MSWEDAFLHPALDEELNAIRLKLEERLHRHRFDEKENRANSHRTKSKSAKRRSQNVSRSPLYNKTPVKTPRGKNKTSVDQKSPWKF